MGVQCSARKKLFGKRSIKLNMSYSEILQITTAVSRIHATFLVFIEELLLAAFKLTLQKSEVVAAELTE